MTAAACMLLIAVGLALVALGAVAFGQGRRISKLEAELKALKDWFES